MINITEIRAVFRSAISASGIIPISSIAWENIKFEPTGKSIWLKEDYLPATEGRVTSLGDDIEGIFQYTINIPVNLPTGETTAVNAGVAIGNLFSSSQVVLTTNYQVSITLTRCSFQGKLDDAWYSYIVDIQFRGYEK